MKNCSKLAPCTLLVPRQSVAARQRLYIHGVLDFVYCGLKSSLVSPQRPTKGRPVWPRLTNQGTCRPRTPRVHTQFMDEYSTHPKMEEFVARRAVAAAPPSDI